jgi:predicted phage-related endonuclease
MSETQLILSKTDVAVLTKLKSVEAKYKKLEADRDALKAQLQEIMEKHDIKKFEDDQISITYIDATFREGFDSKKFKEDYPKVYPEYVKSSSVKASVRFKLK